MMKKLMVIQVKNLHILLFDEIELNDSPHEPLVH
jgi:hypothetical protein